MCEEIIIPTMSHQMNAGRMEWRLVLGSSGHRNTCSSNNQNVPRNVWQRYEGMCW